MRGDSSGHQTLYNQRNEAVLIIISLLIYIFLLVYKEEY